MNQFEADRLNRKLAHAGLGQLSDPGLVPQLAYLVRDHDHFRSLLTACVPEHRTAMYEAMRHHLRFEAKPLDVYVAEAGAEAARLEHAVAAVLAKGSLEVTCAKCTKFAVFRGADRLDAIKQARDAGWVLENTAGGGEHEICPECPSSAREFTRVCKNAGRARPELN